MKKLAALCYLFLVIMAALIAIAAWRLWQ